MTRLSFASGSRCSPCLIVYALSAGVLFALTGFELIRGDSPQAPANDPSAALAAGTTYIQDEPPTRQPDDEQAAPWLELADVQDELFETIVTDNGLVRYTMLRDAAHAKKLQQLVRGYAQHPIPDDRNQRLAFLCNAYNVNVLQLVVKHDLPARVLDVDGFFKKESITVSGIKMTLDVLENEHVRKLGDPRIHAALNCAAVSCPAISRKAFRPDTLDAQFDALCRAWINDSKRNRVERGRVMLSEIFNWFAADFDAEPYKGRVGFIRHFADDGTASGRALLAAIKGKTDKTANIGFLTYDWTLNNAPDNGDG